MMFRNAINYSSACRTDILCGTSKHTLLLLHDDNPSPWSLLRHAVIYFSLAPPIDKLKISASELYF